MLIMLRRAMGKIRWKILILLILFRGQSYAQEGSDYDSWISDSWNDDANSNSSNYENSYDSSSSYDDRYSSPATAPPVYDDLAKPVEKSTSDSSTLFDSWAQPNSTTTSQPNTSTGA